MAHYHQENPLPQDEDLITAQVRFHFIYVDLSAMDLTSTRYMNQQWRRILTILNN
jgi:hypothetical protein